ncbi:MAG: hypothetical protein J1E61_06055 [Lachnospiraceae bacterium]|nr:hypothetical protein [Lachnospiraceae bacterium]
MTGMEIVLLFLGIVVFAASFFIPEKAKETDEKTLELGEEKVKEIITEQMKEAKEQLRDAVDETVSYAVEKSERSLERVSNEKITSVSEFSETVMEDIHKSHQEVMFLYDMLHDKQKNLQETVKAADQTNERAKETKNELETVVQEAAMVEPIIEKADSFQPIPVPRVPAAGSTVRIIEPVTEEKPKEEMEQSGNNNEKILEMHKQGKSNVAIAKELGLGVGEVNLVIDLFEVI